MSFTNQEFQIKHLGKQDAMIFKNLIELFQKVFEMKNHSVPQKSYLQRLLENPDFIVYAIIHKNEVVGGLTAYQLHMYYSEHSEIFIYDVAIKPGFQKKGLGKNLILALKEYCRKNGIKEIFVAAHEEDKHALDFYESTGGKAEKAIYFNYLIEK
jgi:aminoglycoside 3-N-acetyltransferase I